VEERGLKPPLGSGSGDFWEVLQQPLPVKEVEEYEVTNDALGRRGGGIGVGATSTAGTVPVVGE
jgi:hypothetical protein